MKANLVKFLKRLLDYSFVTLLFLAAILAWYTAEIYEMNNPTGKRIQSSPVMSTKVNSPKPATSTAILPKEEALPSTEQLPSQRTEPARLIRASYTAPSRTVVQPATASSTYRPYTVKHGETLTSLVGDDWKRVCDINVQFGSIKTADCRIVADQKILLPVAVHSTASTSPDLQDYATRLAALEKKVEEIRQEICQHDSMKSQSECSRNQSRSSDSV